VNAPAPRELPGWLKHATLWLLLGAGLFVAVQAWQRNREAARFTVATSGQILIERSGDGQFHWPGSVAGEAVDFLVDTGASSTAIPLALAERLNLPVQGHVQSNTAGGVVNGRVVVADVVLQGGVAAQRLRLVALPRLDKPLLGMDVLGRLRWSQDGGVLRVAAPTGGG
jgi:aspartyl protease family protein